MSTPKEKVEAVKAAMQSTQKRIDRLEYLLKSRGIIAKAERYELDMCYELMNRGKKLIESTDEGPDYPIIRSSSSGICKESK